MKKFILDHPYLSISFWCLVIVPIVCYFVVLVTGIGTYTVVMSFIIGLGLCAILDYLITQYIERRYPYPTNSEEMEENQYNNEQRVEKT